MLLPAQMEIGGRAIVYPPIHEDIDKCGEPIYRVVLSDQTVTIQRMVPIPTSREEAHRRVHGILRLGLETRRYQATDNPQHANDTYRYMPPPRAVMYAAPEEPEEEEEDDEAYDSGEAVVALPEITSVMDGACSVCLQEYEAGSRLRMMPCAHAFHEQCILQWLRVGHGCPLCRCPLASETDRAAE